MKLIIDIVGLIGSAGIALSLFPQTYKTIFTIDFKSISTYFIFITMLSSLFQLIYGVYYLIIPMIIANTCVLLNSLILFIYISCNRQI